MRKNDIYVIRAPMYRAVSITIIQVPFNDAVNIKKIYS